MEIKRRDFLKVAAAGGLTVASNAHPALAREAKGRIKDAVGFLYDSTVCTGCKACVSACKQNNDLPQSSSTPQDPLWDNPLDTDSRTYNIIKLYKDGTGAVKDREKDGHAYIKRQCMHCVDPSCVSACPVSALQKDPKTGIVTYNKSACIGCRYCQLACPFNIPKFEFDKTFPQIRKCQLCDHRIPKGDFAACAQYCPTGATVYGRVEDLLAEAKKRLAYKPGTWQVYPVERLGGPVTTEREVTPYIQKIYGEKDGGGTQNLILAGVPFEKLGLPKLDERPDAQRSETIQHTIYKGMIAPIALLGGLLYVVHKSTKDHK
ncbi:MAG: hydrogenase 2 operon protein HybA [Nitrospiraceae bacterium]|nr:hydrogenase 2 operon protein HybA [Nitrospiraceae bacterium]